MPTSFALKIKQPTNLGKVNHLLFMSYGKAQIKSIGLHTFSALATRLSTNTMYQGTIFKPISCFQTNLAKRHRLYS